MDEQHKYRNSINPETSRKRVIVIHSENLQVTQQNPIVIGYDFRFIFLLPQRDYMGRRVIFYRPGVLDPKCPNIARDAQVLSLMVYEAVLEDEENQIRGVVHLVDLKNIRMPHVTMYTPQHLCRLGKNTEVRVTIQRNEDRY